MGHAGPTIAPPPEAATVPADEMSRTPSQDRDAPLIGIGLPTFNRSRALERAIESALGQTHRNIELVISDNASTDGTQALCRQYADRDPRVRYVRNAVNVGAVANFNTVIAALTGEYAMLLADDDWLEPDYLERCLDEMDAHPDRVLVAGLARHYQGDHQCGSGQQFQLLQGDPAARIARYFSEVQDNGIYYGLMQANVMRAAAPLHHVLASDWLFVAAVISRGKAQTITSTRLNRTTGGASASLADSVRASRVSRGKVRIPHFHTAATAFADMAWRSVAYEHLSTLARLSLAVRCAPKLIRWRDATWLLVGPTMLRFRRHPRGRWVWRLFEAVARRAGAFSGGVPPV
jgi:glycosyltransferase involved in cell wall biosynthesis